MHWSLFAHVTNTTAQDVEEDWPAFARHYLLAKPRAMLDKRQAGMYSPARFSGPRSEPNVQTLSAVVLDFDNTSDTPSLPEDHADNLGDLTYAWHTTHSHTQDAPRWRLVIPFDREVTRAEFVAIFPAVLELLGDDPNIDRTCGEVSRAYWLPSAKPEHLQDARSGFSEGEPLKVDELLDERPAAPVIPLNAPRWRLETPSDRTAPVLFIPAYAGRNDALKAQVAACRRKGKTQLQTAQEILAFDIANHNPPLFCDPTDPQQARHDPEANAFRFVASVWGSIAGKREAAGLTPEEYRAPAPAFELRPAKHLMADLRGTDYLIKPFCERDTLSILFGDSGTYKSFILLDQLLHVAYGMDYHGHPTHQGPAVLVVGEGSGGIARRIAAWKLAHNKPLDDDVPLYVSTLPAQLIDQDNAQTVADAVAHHCEHAAMIGIDTLSTNAGDADESSNADMARLMVNIGVHLRARFRACIKIVHHVGHGEKGRERGAYTIRGNADARERAEMQDEATRTVNFTCEKVKDGEHWPPVAFRMERIEIPGIADSEGEPVHSLVPHLADYAEPKRDEPAKGNAGKAESIVFQLATEQRQRVCENGYVPPSEVLVSFEDVRARFLSQLEKEGMSSDSARRAWNRSKGKLVDKFGNAPFRVKIDGTGRDNGGT